MDAESVRFRILNDPPCEAVYRLYREAGWLDPEDTPETIAALVSGSFCFCGAFMPDGTMIGMMRALSDGVSDAYLLDLVVQADCRKHGIGQKILSVLSDHLRGLGIGWIVLIGAPGTESFYRKSQFAAMEGHTPYRDRVPKGE